MKIYKIEIQETLSRIVEVKAESEDDAYTQVKGMYEQEEIVLDCSDFLDTKINRKLDNQEEIDKDTLISEIVEYLYRHEKRHFEEFDADKPSDHIFLKLKKLKKLI